MFYEPVRELEATLKCRGPVTPDTAKVVYELEIKEIGYRPEPYVIADAYMYADGRSIVYFHDMSMQMSGITRDEIESFWKRRNTVASVSSGQPAALQNRGIIRTMNAAGKQPLPPLLPALANAA